MEMDTFDDLTGRLNRLQKSAERVYKIANELRALKTTGPAEVELLQKLVTGLIDDLSTPATVPPPPTPYI